MKPTSLRELYVQELKDLYDAEQQITKALPKMLRSATAEDLQQALSRHLEVTKEHVSRLEEIFARFDEKPKAEKKLSVGDPAPELKVEKFIKGE